jgi:Ca2+-transporting ATPase
MKSLLTDKTGLSSDQAAQRLSEFGYNELPSAKPKTIWGIAREVMREPMFLLLIACSVLYMLLGDYREGLILFSTIAVVIFITFYQYQKTEKALDALRKLAAPRVLVIRDGIEARIPGREVVPDDIMILHEGDRVGADAVVVSSGNLTIDESLLTGESLPVSKSLDDENPGTRQVYSGTLVTQGTGLARVTATGVNTEFGKIGRSLQAITQDETRLQKEMKGLIRTLFIIGIGLCVLVIAAFYFTKGNFIQSLLNGLAATMAILPEEFPVILTVFLALGSWRLSKGNVLTRKPSAIETLGSATVLCSDKTGTITQNKMEVAAVYNGVHSFPKKDFAGSPDIVGSIIRAGCLASHEGTIDPMEKAILAAGSAAGTYSVPGSFVKEYPLSRELLAMTIVRRTITSELVASAKGSPEAILGLCQITEAERARHLAIVHTLAEKGYRILGVASATISMDDLPERQEDFLFQFKGLLALEDPIREEVPAAVAQCHNAGLRVIMITGDFPATARSIGGQIGLPAEGLVLSGDDLKRMSDAELQATISSVSIFARVIPEQKLRIVNVLKGSGEVVAMTGDGVNDAPALKAADIGIAMGKKGTDVAREASSLVLLDDNFASIVAAIRSGRRIFDNLQKAMSYVMAIHIPIIGLTLIPALLSSIPLLLMPLHIVFMELLIDPACSIAFEYEQEEHNIMNRPPRHPASKFFGSKRILRSVFNGSLLLAMVLAVYFISVKEGHSVMEARAITFCALIIGNVALIMASLSASRPFYAGLLERNYALLIILAAAFLMLFLTISLPQLRMLFAFEFPGYKHFVTSLTGAAIILLILEAEKLLQLRHRRRRYAQMPSRRVR